MLQAQCLSSSSRNRVLGSPILNCLIMLELELAPPRRADPSTPRVREYSDFRFRTPLLSVLAGGPTGAPPGASELVFFLFLLATGGLSYFFPSSNSRNYVHANPLGLCAIFDDKHIHTQNSIPTSSLL